MADRSSHSRRTAFQSERAIAQQEIENLRMGSASNSLSSSQISSSIDISSRSHAKLYASGQVDLIVPRAAMGHIDPGPSAKEIWDGGKTATTYAQFKGEYTDAEHAPCKPATPGSSFKYNPDHHAIRMARYLKDFDAVGVLPELRNNLRICGYHHPFPVQSFLLETSRQEVSAIVEAPFGTGKTSGAFVAAINFAMRDEYHQIQDQERIQLYQDSVFPTVIFLATTHERALEIHASIASLLQPMQEGGICIPITAGIVYGGTDVDEQWRLLGETCNILVATPGRFEHFLRERIIRPELVRLVILDEADNILSGNLGTQVEEIVEIIRQYRFAENCPENGPIPAISPEDILTMVISPPIDAMYRSEFLSYIATKHITTPHASLLNFNDESDHNLNFQILVRDCSGKDRVDQGLLDVLRHDIDTRKSIMVVAYHNNYLKAISNRLRDNGYSCAEVHGSIRQQAREEALHSFKLGTCKIMVCSPAACEGMNFKLDQLIFVDYPDMDSGEGRNFRSLQSIMLNGMARVGRLGVLGKVVMLVDLKDGVKDLLALASVDKVLEKRRLRDERDAEYEGPRP